MKARPAWIGRLDAAWGRRPIVWLAGVRRVGKTTLARMIPGAVFLNCDLPSTEQRIADAESFFGALATGATVVLDEVHRLPDPSRTLKIAADAFPHLRILATGSSTLAATRRFRDSLTGRKTSLVLAPVLWPECGEVFGVRELDRRLRHGGMPEMLLAETPDDAFYAEWMDSFYARDVQDLFGIRDRTGFLKLLRFVFRQSGGLLDYSALSRECDLSRATVKAHVEAVSIACALNLLPPFHAGGSREIVRRPKAYAFDTGFVCFVRGWRDVRNEDRGFLWEHLVLDVLRTAAGGDAVLYWRDKSGREVDFVVRRRGAADAVECKINPDKLDVAGLEAFRGFHPDGRNFVVCPGVAEPYDRRVGGLVVRVTNCREMLTAFGDGDTG